MLVSDIPKLTRVANYSVTIQWGHLKSWVEKQEEMNLDVNPDFQRAHVWTEIQQSSYIEFILKGGFTGKDLYFNCPDWTFSPKEICNTGFTLVDGKQRLAAVLRFLNNEISVFDNVYLDDFDNPKGLLRSKSFTVNINDLQTRAEVLQWYIDFNNGGTPHSKEEINKVIVLLEGES